MTVDSAPEKNGVRVPFRRAGCDHLVAAVGFLELAKGTYALAGMISRTVQDFRRIQLVGHIEQIRRQALVMIARPHSRGEHDSNDMVSTVDRLRPPLRSRVTKHRCGDSSDHQS